MKQIHNLQQGNQDWHDFRFNHRGASETAAMLGLSETVKRNELLLARKTGIAKEFSRFVEERVFPEGHRVEPLARKVIEELIDDELYPVVYSDDLLSASCDGITMDEKIAFECKQYNQTLFELVENGTVPDTHMPQCQQILMITGAESLYFTVSDGTKERTAWTLVKPSDIWFESIRAGWEQFEKDLIDFEVRLPEVKAVAEAKTFLMPSVVVNGSLAINSNLPDFGAQLRQFVAGLTADPQTDQDFADLEQAVKDLKLVEDRLTQTEDSALAQIQDVNEMRTAVAELKNLARTARLQSEKLVKTQKEVIKLTILNDAQAKFTAHVKGLQAEIKGVVLSIDAPDFAGAIKNKRSLDSLREAVDTLLANSKIQANAKAAEYREKLAWCGENAAGFSFLFADLALIIVKPLEDFKLVINSRIEEHKKAELIKAEQAAKEQAEREARLVREAAEKATREAELKAAREAEEKKRLEQAEAIAAQEKAKIEQAEKETVEREAAALDEQFGAAAYHARQEEKTAAEREAALNKHLGRPSPEVEPDDFGEIDNDKGNVVFKAIATDNFGAIDNDKLKALIIDLVRAEFNSTKQEALDLLTLLFGN